MNKRIESIKARLDELNEQYLNATVKSKADIKESEERIASLEEQIKNAQDITEYKKTQKAISDERECLNFLMDKKKKCESGILDDVEYKQITGEIKEEVEIIQEKYAPIIQKMLFDVIAKMDEYNAEIKVLEDTQYRAKYLHTPHWMTNKTYFASNIGDQTPDKCGWWKKFVFMYFSHCDEADNIKNGKKASRWF